VKGLQPAIRINYGELPDLRLAAGRTRDRLLLIAGCVTGFRIK